jgi:hypothetical protein
MGIFGGLFGPLNDVCNGVMAVLTAVLAWRLRDRNTLPAGPRQAAPGVAAAGAVIAVAGSALVIFRVTGWYLAGQVTAFGYALIGVWLVSASRAAERTLAWPRRLARLGQAAGGLMMLGFLTGPGILRGVDSMENAPWWVSLGLLGALGWLVLLPVWALYFARRAGPRGAPSREMAKV